MMKKLALLTFLLGLSVLMLGGCSLFQAQYRDVELQSLAAPKKWTLRSPDGSLLLEIALSAQRIGGLPELKSNRLIYRLVSGKNTLVRWSELGIELQSGRFYEKLKVVSETNENYQDRYKLAHGKSSLQTVKAHRLSIVLANEQSQQIKIQFHLQNDGAAFRYILEDDSGIKRPQRVLREYSSFNLPADRPAWMQEYQEASKVSPAYEYYYNRIQTGKSHEGKRHVRSLFNPLVEFTGLVIFGSDGWAMPALIEAAPQQFVLVSEAGLDGSYAGSHLDNDGQLYRLELPAQKEGLGLGDRHPQIQNQSWSSPWRVMIAGDLATVFTSSMITDLSAPLDPIFKGQIPGWVKPGKVAWDWWSYLQTGDFERQKKYVDAAAEFGWQYVLVDANWNKWPDVETKIPELVAYARQKNIGVLLWYNSGGPNNRVTEEPRDRMHQKQVRAAEFARLRKWGVKGVKIDFWQSDKQVTIQQYLDVLADAARHELMVNVHGSTIPRGWRRRFPNLMTNEAVKGAEWYRFPVFRGPNAHDNVYYAFIRNAIGSMDYTPVVFQAALEDQSISYAHSLALAVVFESAWQHLADNSDQSDQGYRLLFSRFPFVKNFLAVLPTAWDETRLLYGHPDQAIVVARRLGSRWYVGGISASDQPLTIKLDLSFLSKPGAGLKLITDAKIPSELQLVEGTNPTKDWQITLPPRGGFVMY